MPLEEDPIPELKRQLAGEICRIVGPYHHYLAAHLLNIDASRMSDLKRGRLARFSLQRLVRMLAEVEHRVDLRVMKVGTGELVLAFKRVGSGRVTLASRRLLGDRRGRHGGHATHTSIREPAASPGNS